jgi:PAS domain S-box-containing protein
MGQHAEDPCVPVGSSDELIDAYIGENARLEQLLRETQLTLADAQRLTKTGSWVIDPISGAASCSAEGYRILGLPGKTASSHYMECLANVHPDDIGEVLHGFQEAVETGEPRPLHYRIVHPGGTTTDVETVAQPVRDEAGHIARVVGTVMDVTERNRAKHALRASERLARGKIEALTRTLSALVQETSTDRLPEPVLRTIVEQLDADGITVWLTDQTTGQTHFAFQFVDDRLLAAPDAPHPAGRMSLEAQDNPVWREIVRTGQYHICADVTHSSRVPFRDFNLAEGIATILVVPMLIAGRVAGMIAIRFLVTRTFRPEEIEWTQALADQAMLAIQLARLSEQNRQSAVIAERNRIARDVHDTLAQNLTGVILQLEASEDAASRGLAGEATAHRARASAMARGGLAEARRSVLALRPQALEHHDLATALGELVSRMTEGTGVVADFTQSGGSASLPPGWDEQVLRIGQETLTNALRHAGARRVAMQLILDPAELRFELRDDGRGFDPIAPTEGAGLAGIRDRGAAMGAHVHITSAVGAGTTVAVTVPLPVSADCR